MDSESEMADAVGRLHSTDPQRCRESASERFHVAAVAAGCEDAYRDVLARSEPARA